MTASQQATAQQVEAQKAQPIPWATLSIVIAAMFVAILDSFVVVVASPSIVSDLHASEGGVQWVLAGYQLSYAVFIITASRLADVYGRKRIFLLGLLLFLVASVACALSPSVGALVISRVIQGVGAALMVPQVFAYITILVPSARRPAVFGVLGIVFGVAPMCGQVLGGLIVDANILGSGWRLIFGVNVPIGIALIALAVRYLPTTAVIGSRKFDIPGVAALSLALVLLTYPVIQGREAGWPWQTWACLVGSAVAFWLFIRIERRLEVRGAAPLIPLALFRQRSFSLGIVLVLALYAFIYSYNLALTVTMQQGLGLSALNAGLVQAPQATAILVFSVIAARFVPRYGLGVMKLGILIMIVGFLAVGIILISGPEVTPLLVIPALIVQGIGAGMVVPQSLNAVLSRIEPESAGVASGILSTTQQCGGALGVAVIGTVYFSVFHSGTSGKVVSATHAFAAASFGVTVLAVIAAVVVYLLPKAPAGQR